MSLSNFSINGSSINPTLFKGSSRNFNFLIDEPKALGGQDLAPNPVEYLLAGYAGCLNVVINLVAKELEITIQELNININGNIDASKLLGFSKEGRAGFQSLSVDIDINTDASEDKANYLLSQVKHRCPINDNLSQTTPIKYHIKTAKNDKLYV